MSLVIQGKDGQLMTVTNRNMARALATQYSIQADVTIDLARSWTVLDTQTPTGAADYFFYLLNGSNIDMVVTRIMGQAPTAEQVTLQEVTGTAAGGTVFAPANRTAGSGRTPPSGVVAQVGANITGLSALGFYEQLNIPAAGKDSENLIERPLVIRPGRAIALLAVAGAIAITFAVDYISQVIEVAEVP